MWNPEDLYTHPNPLAKFYNHFRVGERLLLTGHSHQAWPDCGFEGLKKAWEDAAEGVDEKWPRAFEKAERVCRGYARLLDDTTGSISLAAATHDLVIKFLSGLPLKARPEIITTDGEFHALRRQLDRLAEEGIAVIKVAAHPPDSVAERLIDKITDRTAVVMVSSVFFQTAQIATGLGEVMKACNKKGAELLVDTYHHLNVIPFSLKTEGLEDAYVVGGGYKYCQLGEGNGFLRSPSHCDMRPVITGWFSEFDTISGSKKKGEVLYGAGPARFAGATYDPTSHYRAAEVFDFFEERKLTPELLRTVSQHQIKLLAHLFDELDLPGDLIRRDTETSLERIGGFLTLQSPRAGDIHQALLKEDVFTDYRGQTLRLGPAPYLSDRQLEEAMAILGELVRAL